mmetsp:Transcript_60002/g.178604  ORF Transcript_60002/g.178604 Transcript_60002/m.178604 type:complete len:249 (+) Transcript_60002:329-1075(+)
MRSWGLADPPAAPAASRRISACTSGATADSGGSTTASWWRLRPPPSTRRLGTKSRGCCPALSRCALMAWRSSGWAGTPWPSRSGDLTTTSPMAGERCGPATCCPTGSCGRAPRGQTATSASRATRTGSPGSSAWRARTRRTPRAGWAASGAPAATRWKAATSSCWACGRLRRGCLSPPARRCPAEPCRRKPPRLSSSCTSPATGTGRPAGWSPPTGAWWRLSATTGGVSKLGKCLSSSRWPASWRSTC